LEIEDRIWFEVRRVSLRSEESSEEVRRVEQDFRIEAGFAGFSLRSEELI